MKVAVLTAPRRFKLVDEPVPKIGPDEVLVRVVACGVCGSELEMWTGRVSAELYPRYPGHEVSGMVEQVGGQVQGFRPGEPVAVWTTGRGFAGWVAVKAKFCFPAEAVPLDQALAEPLSCAVNTVELANLSLGDDVVLIGAGFMGSLVLKLVVLQGPRSVVVADTRPDALVLAMELGATHTVDLTRESLPEAVKKITGGKGADVSFEVTGVQAPLDLLGDITRMSGKLVIVGFHQGAPRTIPLGYWNWMAFKILNAHFREEATILNGMQAGMRLLSSGRLSLADLVTHRFPLAEIDQAFATAVEKPGGFVKSVVVME